MTAMNKQIAGIFTGRSELSFRNIRINKWAAIIIFPLSFIICDMRHFHIETSFFGLESFTLIHSALGLGWLTLFFLPQRLIIPALRLSSVLCAVILPFQMILQEGLPLLATLMAFQFFIGVCLGASFSVFCFKLNNAERLLGMFIIASCFGIFYHIFSRFPSFAVYQKTWVSTSAILLYLVTVFCCFRKKDNASEDVSLKKDVSVETAGSGFNFSVFLIILLVFINQIMWIMMNDMAAKEQVNFFSFGFGKPAAIILIIAVHFCINKSALYSWLLSIVFSLLGGSLLLFDSPFTLHAGSFLWGLGDSVGYIITFFMCGGAIKLSKSFKMFRVFCFSFFIYYAVLSGIFFNLIYPLIEVQSRIVSFGIVLTLCCVCFMMLPYLQRKIFDAPWSDGLKLIDVGDAPALAKTEQLNEDEAENLGLSPREKEIFILLLGDSQRKHIADTLKIGSGTVNFHINNLYHKLGIQSRIELFAKYGKKQHGEKPVYFAEGEQLEGTN